MPIIGDPVDLIVTLYFPGLRTLPPQRTWYGSVNVPKKAGYCACARALRTRERLASRAARNIAVTVKFRVLCIVFLLLLSAIPQDLGRRARGESTERAPTSMQGLANISSCATR